MTIKFAHRASIILYNLLVSMPNEKVFLLPANVCPIVPAVFIKANRGFRFVDINPNTLCMDLSEAKTQLQTEAAGIGGLLYVRNYGYKGPQINAELQSIKQQYPKLLLIDDQCICEPDFSPDDLIDVNLYSTGYSKFVELGYGGFACINDNVPYSENDLDFKEREHEKLTGLFHHHLGEESSISDDEWTWIRDGAWLGDTTYAETLSAYQKQVLEEIPKIRKHKNAINSIYHEQLPSDVQLPKGFHNWRFNILVENKEEILQKIFDETLFASSHYQPLTEIFGSGESENARWLHEKVVNLFNDWRINETFAQKVSGIVASHGVPTKVLN